MQVTVIARTLNESDYVDRFCYGYRWADKILLADGGSGDDTVQRAARYSNVEVRRFPLVYHNEEHPHLYMNPVWHHLQFLVHWAHEDVPDWIILDDFDCVPNRILHDAARERLAGITAPVVAAYRLYLWGHDKYFPVLNKPGQSLWGWKPKEVDVWPARVDHIHPNFTGLPPVTDWHRLEQRECLIHLCWPDEKRWLKKKEWYAAWGQPQEYPPKSCGPMVNLPDWARE